MSRATMRAITRVGIALVLHAVALISLRVKGSSGQGSIEECDSRTKVLDIQGVCDDGIDTLEPQLEPIGDSIEKARRVDRCLRASLSWLFEKRCSYSEASKNFTKVGHF